MAQVIGDVERFIGISQFYPLVFNHVVRVVVTEVGFDRDTRESSVVALFVDFGEQKVLYPNKGEVRKAVPKRLLDTPVQVSAKKLSYGFHCLVT